MSTNLKIAKEKIINAGFRLEGEEEILIEEIRKKYNLLFSKNIEKILQIIINYLEAKLENFYNITKTVVPKLIRDPNTVKSFIFLSKDFTENKCLCVFIPDRGENHPTVLNKSSLIYDSLKKGTLFPYVDFAYKENYSFLIMNPNFTKDSSGKSMSEYTDHYSHCEYIWNEYVSGKRYEHIIVIAHQLASISLIKLVNRFKSDFMKYVKRIALINSIHKNFYEILDDEAKFYFQKVTTNYIPSTEPKGTLLYSCNESDDFVANRSCGTTNLGLTHYFIYDDIFKNNE